MVKNSFRGFSSFDSGAFRVSVYKLFAGKQEKEICVFRVLLDFIDSGSIGIAASSSMELFYFFFALLLDKLGLGYSCSERQFYLRGNSNCPYFSSNNYFLCQNY